MNRASRHIAALVIVLASLFGAAACVTVPTSGPVEKVEGQQARGQNYVNVEVVPPAPGEKKKQIVEGYLRANNSYQPNYLVAKQFLTRAAAEKWTPEAGTWIYTGLPKDKGESVALDGWLVGSLRRDRTYKADDRALGHDFGLIDEDGEWRINNPPPGLMVAQFYFDSFYRTYDLYFVGNGSSLVPDPIYLPALSNPANVASALIKRLLTGPSEWLKPAVSTAIPPNTSLSVDSVTITDGIAEVPLSDSVLDLPDQQRSLLAAQIAYTLRQVVGVKGVAIKVNQQPYRVPGSDPNSLAISVDAIPRDLDPVRSVAGDQLYAVQDKAVKEVTATASPPNIKDLDGPGSLGGGGYTIDALAVSLTNTDFAATTHSGTRLLRSPIGDGAPIALLSPHHRVSELLRPQFTRYNEIWTIGTQGGQRRIWMFTADPPASPGGASKITTKVINSPELRNVRAFRISPDGTRMALVRDSEAGGSELVLATIIRSNKITVGGWRVLDTAQRDNASQIGNIRDVAWLDATELLVLGAAPADTALAPYLVAEDASTIAPHGEPGNKDGVELAVLPGRQTVIIRGGDKRLWRDDGSQLPINDVRAIAYPG